MTAKTVRCAIYTRKSTEEGLDQAFNSLDAQREACESYIASQRHEGWKVLPKPYSDGGFSGGNTQRPALQDLLRDIAAGKVDLVVVYKIDRLTRSLTDFAKMVDVLDAHHTSFVSITQHFNTTTSMGRLTLNVLLSFAQFEREVTSERIRDKIAASKKKGMWVGGAIPLGYDIEDKRMIVDDKEAAQVCGIFQRYLEVGCVQKLKSDLDARGIRGKVRVSKAGHERGGGAFSRGALYWMLRNRMYRGEVSHHGQYYPGQHDAIVDRSLWDAVQVKLDHHRTARQRAQHAKITSLLAGMIRWEDGQRLTPSFTVKQGKRYRYYVSRQHDVAPRQDENKKVRVPAHEVEQLAEREWLTMLQASSLAKDMGLVSRQDISKANVAAAALVQRWPSQSIVQKREVLLAARLSIQVGATQLVVACEPAALRDLLLGASALEPIDADPLALERVVAINIWKSRREIQIVESAVSATQVEFAAARTQCLKRIALGRQWIEALVLGKIDSLKQLAVREQRTESFVYDVVRAGSFSPRLVEALIDENDIGSLSAKRFKDELPIDWEEQKLSV
ncbi:MAG: recombinase family protein [Luteimonas sp.]